MSDLAAGGKALVTVWAEEQLDAKKLAKWQRMPAPNLEAASTDGSDRDYLVPWHVPSHRPETAAISAAAQDHAAELACGRDATPAIKCGADASRVASGAVDAQKGTVVFQRYYHLFREGELEELAAQLPTACSVVTFYNKDNWCLVLEKKS